MREVEFKSSFARSYKKLVPDEQLQVDNIVRQLMDIFDSGMMRHGLGIKKLRNNIWEARIDLSLRICFKLDKDVIQFFLVGNHEDIRNFLKKS